MATWAVRVPSVGRNAYLREYGANGRILGFGREEDAHRFVSQLTHRGYPTAPRLRVEMYPGRVSGSEVSEVKSSQVIATADYLADTAG